MCGIAGIISKNKDTLQRVNEMLKTMEHRGPDDTGSFFGNGVALGQNRLSIIDLSGGHQPMYNRDKTLTLIFNGEIYNYKDLTDDLARKGYVFQTKSDSEVLIHMYEEYGHGMLSRLNGMFAFAIFDSRNNEVFIARDRLGVKPIYYTETTEFFAFASEIQALRKIPDVEAALYIRPEALWHYFSLLYIPPPLTIFQNIRIFPAGHFMIVKDGGTTLSEYWRPNLGQITNKSFDDCLAELEALLDDAVRLRMQSDVPYGAYLSGGVDSSLIVGKMAAASPSPVKTFTAIVEDDALNEKTYAAQIAEKYHTDHHELPVGGFDFSTIKRLLGFFGQPFADSSLLPTYLISKKIREHVTVVLSGDGSDELFSGYDKYKGIDERSSDEAVRQAFLNRVPTGAKESLLAPLAKEGMVDTFTFLASHPHNAGYYGYDLLRFLDIEFFLKGDILAKVDHMSMANSLEARGPFLDYRIAELALTLPREYLAANGETKKIVKRILEKYMPSEFVQRQKVGFHLPVSAWLKAHAPDILALVPPPVIAPYFNRLALETLVRDYENGRDEYGHILFAYLVCCHWADSLK